MHLTFFFLINTSTTSRSKQTFLSQGIFLLSNPYNMPKLQDTWNLGSYSCPYDPITHTQKIHHFCQSWQVCSCSGFVPTSITIHLCAVRLPHKLELQKSKRDNFLSLLLFLSPCLSIYLLFSLSVVQEQYLSLHLTLIFHSSYSKL